MPKELEKYLRKEATKLHLHGIRKKAYIYGTLRKIEKAHEKHEHSRHHLH